MTGLQQTPEWLGGAVVGAVIAALGYVVKLLIEEWRSLHAARAERLASLAALSSLLRAGWVSFVIQNAHAQRLVTMLADRGAIPGISEEGYEHTITAAFPNLAPEEQELHGIIRGITIHSIRPVNQALLDWLRKDVIFKGLSHRPGLAGELARKLSDLEAHLVLWHAKYEAWIPQHPAHALVYLADEQAHGLGFPKGLDQLVGQALAKRSWFWN